MRFYWLWNLIEDSYIFIIAIWLIGAVILKGSRHDRKYLIISAVVYTLILLYLTLLGRTAKSEPQMELSFLWEYRLALQGHTGWWVQIFDNIMLFVPMGWLWGGLYDGLREPQDSWKKGVWWKAILFGLCASFAIELCQLVFKLGLFEFDDILNNTIGMIVGYGIYRVVARRCSV